MADAWRRFRAAYLMELRLLCRHWSYLALHVIWASLLWYGNRDAGINTARYLLETGLGHMGLGLISLTSLFVAAAAASRSHRARFTALDETLPTGLEVPLGRWLATVTALMGALAEPLALAALAGPASSWWSALPVYLGEGLITVAFTSAFAWLLVDWLGMRRWLYPVLGAWWLAFLVGQDMVNSPSAGMPELKLFDFMRMTSGAYRDMWGRLLEGSRPLWFNLFYLGLALLFLAGIAWRVRQKRLRRMPALPALAAFLAAAVAVAGGAGYFRQMQTWSQLADTDQARVNELSAQILSRPRAPEVIDRYAVTADLTTPSAPRFTARMTIRNSGLQALPTVTLTLHHSFTVTETSLPLNRTGDFLSVQLPEPLPPGGATDLTLEYSGSLFLLAPRWNQIPVPMFFTTEQGVRLADPALWYPEAGQQLPTVYERREDVAPFAFDLQVKAPKGWGVISNLAPAGPGHFAGTGATWAMLLASPSLAVEQVGAITLAGSRDQLARAAAYVTEFQKAMDDLSRFFPGVKPDGMTIIIFDGYAGVPDGTTPDGNHAVVLTEQNAVIYARRFPANAYWYIGNPLFRDLWTMSGGVHLDDPILMAVGQFLWAHYQLGDDAAQMTALADQRNPVMRALAEVYAQQGESGILRVLAKLREDPPPSNPELTPDYLDAWVKEAARSDS
jgi:hypothetical protein